MAIAIYSGQIGPGAQASLELAAQFQGKIRGVDVKPIHTSEWTPGSADFTDGQTRMETLAEELEEAWDPSPTPENPTPEWELNHAEPEVGEPVETVVEEFQDAWRPTTMVLSRTAELDVDHVNSNGG